MSVTETTGSAGQDRVTDSAAAKVREALDIVNASTVDCMACDEVVVLLAEVADMAEQEKPLTEWTALDHIAEARRLLVEYEKHPGDGLIARAQVHAILGVAGKIGRLS